MSRRRRDCAFHPRAQNATSRAYMSPAGSRGAGLQARHVKEPQAVLVKDRAKVEVEFTLQRRRHAGPKRLVAIRKSSFMPPHLPSAGIVPNRPCPSTASVRSPPGMPPLVQWQGQAKARHACASAERRRCQSPVYTARGPTSFWRRALFHPVLPL